MINRSVHKMLRRVPLFNRTLLVLGLAVVLTLSSMLRYPGGTTIDHSSIGYSLSRNFLSDLGMTVSYNGQSNSLGALLFIFGLILTTIAVGTVLLHALRRCSTSRQAKGVARAAGAVGLAACFAFLGVAFTPMNSVMAPHLDFTLWGFRLAPLAVLLLTIAASVTIEISTRTMLTFAALTLVLCAYLAMLEWGPLLTTATGLVTQVVAQKSVVVAVLLATAYASYDRGHVAVRPLNAIP